MNRKKKIAQRVVNKVVSQEINRGKTGFKNNIEFRIEENTASPVSEKTVLITTYDLNKSESDHIGFMEVEGFDESFLKNIDACKKDLESLKNKVTPTNPLPIFAAYTVHLEEEYRGRGIGSSLYKKAIDHIRRSGSFFFIPWECVARGGTSEDARKVWLSLNTKYITEGSVIFID